MPQGTQHETGEAAVSKTILLNCSQEHAFRVFTERMGAWWPATQIAGSLAAGSPMSHPIVTVLFLEALAVTVLSWRFLFMIPVALSGPITASLAIALFVGGQARSEAAHS
jgi:hypothetical protein